MTPHPDSRRLLLNVGLGTETADHIVMTGIPIMYGLTQRRKSQVTPPLYNYLTAQCNTSSIRSSINLTHSSNINIVDRTMYTSTITKALQTPYI